VQERITDQTSFEAVRDIVAAGNEPIVQFSKPIYTPRLLEELNDLTKTYGSKLQIRFFGHYGSKFDFSNLSYLPNVSNLAVDCLMDAENIQCIKVLNDLRYLSLGVYNGIPSDILDYENLRSLEGISISESKIASLDIGQISKMEHLKRAHISGFSKNLSSIGGLESLESLSLSQMKKGTSLGFISEIISLKSLAVFLGGRESMEEVRSETVRELSVVRVRGLSELPLGNFPALEKLLIEDQIKLSRLDLTNNKSVGSIIIINCKTLSDLIGLNGLRLLQQLRVSRTSLGIDSLIFQPLPEGLKIFAFYTGSNPKDKAIREKLDSLGYVEFGNL